MTSVLVELIVLSLKSCEGCDGCLTVVECQDAHQHELGEINGILNPFQLLVISLESLSSHCVS